jgi:hypothetical protein
VFVLEFIIVHAADGVELSHIVVATGTISQSHLLVVVATSTISYIVVATSTVFIVLLHLYFCVHKIVVKQPPAT